MFIEVPDSLFEEAFGNYQRSLDAPEGSSEFVRLCIINGIDPMTPNLRRLFITGLAIGSIDGAFIAKELLDEISEEDG